jgi:DNA-binding NarL/FixJ family response regulator
LVVGQTETPAGTLAAARRIDFEVLLLDASLPEAMPVWLQIQNEHPNLRVIILVDTPQQELAWQVIGVETTLLKNALIAQLQNTLAREAV